MLRKEIVPLLKGRVGLWGRKKRSAFEKKKIPQGKGR